MTYAAPVSELRFLLEHVAGLDRVAGTERFAEATPDMVDAILTEAARMCDEVLAPLNRKGDADPARLENGVVRTPEGFGDGWRAISEGGWIGISASPEHGGLGLPMLLTTAVNDMMSGACLALQLAPLMSQGQIEALEAHASDEIKALYLPKLVSGEWSGTMNLTEPQAGSDVGALRTRAEPRGDGTYAVTGQKIYITWGDTDFAENVCHLVLARLPGAPEGTKGISLFVVPKYLPDAEGRPGERNTLKVVSLEHKLGLHGSPTAVMEYEGATGWLVGRENGGMAAMFTMMNNARLGVGTQGIGVAEAAFQQAAAWARDRKQGKAAGTGAIVEHADVKRMLATMRAETFAARAIALMCAGAIDMETATGSAAQAARAALLTPIAKAFGTETGIAAADTGIQVHGGMGFVEETGAAQFLRDVRVTAIYEGTNGIQAMDLVGRKMKDGGEAAFALTDEICEGAEAAKSSAPDLAHAVYEAAETLREATEALVAADLEARFAVAVPYLRAFALVLGGHAHLAAAVHGDAARLRLAEFYIRTILPEHASLLAGVSEGAAVLALEAGELAA
ncbi:acyl-CoA dehydrogenase [Histidinibacterium aquaticum]|uniref:3-methylmercaptopropionyl-CoA dehydrogenase n=1 Tax=Histidinibacterium aquaticum TaxID=2613962 RepID=A0A5J5GQM9_9RHOB|nr:acyl-CoA dehydrogenase [Histidinibacterium aquaticum]KAA9010561.1 acyl-CoA dehydrogenase [Histidinibacterium aquaticum]